MTASIHQLWLFSSSGILASFLFSATASAAPAKPNVLFICVDDLVPTLGCYGDPTAKTPKIDTLAAQGTTFLNHHCAWSVCGPSRVALSTGLTPEETGVMGFKGMRRLLPHVVTIPEHFRKNGYETACAGKFHDPRTTGDSSKPVDSNDQFPGGKIFDDRASWSIPFFKHPHGLRFPGKPASNGSQHPDSDYVDYKILQQGIGVMKKISQGDKPFFLTVGFKKPHLPFYAPKRMWDLYDRDSMPLTSFADLPRGATDANAATLKNNKEILGYAPFKQSGKFPTKAQQKELIHGYYACASWIDYLVGALLKELAATDDPVQKGKKMSETTIIILWGDHGFHLGDHGKWAKHTNMERATSCPLIIFDPRMRSKGAKTMSPASTLDLYPTLCELAGLPVPEQPKDKTSTKGRPLGGVSLVPLLKNPDLSVRDGAITMFKSKGLFGYAYRTQQFRYIEWINKSNNIISRDLYDYKIDPKETKNLINDSAYADAIKKLAKSLHADPSAQGTGRLHAASR